MSLDESVLVLLQVILSRFKSSNMNGLSSILLSYLLPIVTFKPKAATKLCKAVLNLSKMNPSIDTLYLVLLLARTQQVNMAMVMVLIHEPVINTIDHRNNRDVEEEAQDYVDSLLYSMSLVLEHLQSPKGEVKLSSTQKEL